jgi:serine/threonine protein phosphatase 1
MVSQKTFAIADIHGRADLLEAMHSFIADHASVDDVDPQIIYLGDICDRGPQSKKCFNMVQRTLKALPESELICGNHDDWFLRAIRYGEERAKLNWIDKGGVETLHSYYVGDSAIGMSIIDEHHEDHLDLVENASSHVVRGNVCFTHAGIMPGVALDQQAAYDMMWVREDFLEHVGHLSHVVVHGHTPVGDRPVVTENRISLDTNAHVSGRLTAVVIDWEEQTVEFFQTDGDAMSVVKVEPVMLNRGFGFATDFIFGDDELAVAA